MFIHFYGNGIKTNGGIFMNTFIKDYVMFEEISSYWKTWAHENNFENKKWVVAVSGGKDSTIVAALAAKIFGKDNVVGVLLPCEHQSDINDSYKVVDLYCGDYIEINIGDMFNSLFNNIAKKYENVDLTNTRINIPPRLRMTATYAVAQAVDGIVLNTSNLTEDILGYCTLYGDTAGSYAPIQGLTVTEVLQLGDYLKIPHELLYKAPADGLQDKTDEERLGLKYSDVDKYIRDNVGSYGFKRKVLIKYYANKFKLDMIRIPGPKFLDYNNYMPYKRGE